METIRYNGVELTCYFKSFEDDLEITEVNVKDSAVNILNIFTEEQLEEISKQIVEYQIECSLGI